eukprot:451517_1
MSFLKSGPNKETQKLANFYGISQPQLLVRLYSLKNIFQEAPEKQLLQDLKNSDLVYQDAINLHLDRNNNHNNNNNNNNNNNKNIKKKQKKNYIDLSGDNDEEEDEEEDGEPPKKKQKLNQDSNGKQEL